MEAYAVVEAGGKQYRVSKGSVLDIEHVAVEAGQPVTLDRVLAVSDGQELTIGVPTVQGAVVTASVVKNFRGSKVVSYKKKRRKGYHKKIGHRQELSRIKIEDISAAK